MTKIINPKHKFRSLEFRILNLSFGFAQDGEPVEPFRASNFDIRISEHQLGFGLIEIIVAMAIMLIIAVTGVTTVLHSFTINRLGFEKTDATLIAQEGIEAARSIKNQGWANMTVGNHGVDNSGGTWVFSGTSDTIGKYTRVVRLDEIQRADTFCNLDIVATGGIVDQDTFKATSTVTWDFSPTRSNKVELLTYLTNFKFTTQGGSSTQEGVDLTGDRDGLKIQTQGNFAYVARSGGGKDFSVVDISDPCNMVVSAELNLPNTPANIAVSGNYAYVASIHPTEELQVVDITDPASPNLIGKYNASGKADSRGVYYDGTYVYLVRDSSNNKEFFILDVSTPSSPSLVGSLDLGATGYEVVVLGSYAYVSSSDDSQELKVIDVSTPSSPSSVGSLNIAGNADGFTIAGFGSTIILGREQLGSNDNFHVIDVTTPTSPSEIYSFNSGDHVNDVDVGNNNTNAFVASDEDSAEFQVFDISDLLNISQTSTLNLDPDLNGLDYHQSQALIFAVADSDAEELIVVQP